MKRNQDPVQSGEVKNCIALYLQLFFNTTLQKLIHLFLSVLVIAYFSACFLYFLLCKSSLLRLTFVVKICILLVSKIIVNFDNFHSTTLYNWLTWNLSFTIQQIIILITDRMQISTMKMTRRIEKNRRITHLTVSKEYPV